MYRLDKSNEAWSLLRRLYMFVKIVNSPKQAVAIPENPNMPECVAWAQKLDSLSDPAWTFLFTKAASQVPFRNVCDVEKEPYRKAKHRWKNSTI